MPKVVTTRAKAKARRTSITAKEPKKEPANYQYAPPMSTSDIAHVMLLLLTLPMKWFAREQRWVFDYAAVAARVGNRWTERTLRKVPAKFKELMAADGVKKESAKRQPYIWNTVGALTLRVHALHPPMATGESCTSVHERMLADGKDHVTFSTFKKKFKEVKESLGRPPPQGALARTDSASEPR
jgi:hypothetical protein